MRKWIAGVFILLFSLQFGLSQQNGHCGTIDQTAILQRLDMNKRLLKSAPELRNEELLYVPLQFHIVTEDNGNGAIGEEKILEQLCRLNDDYRPVNMRFYLKHDFNYIAYTKLYEDPGNSFSSIKMSANKVNDAVNIFIVDQIGSNSTGTTLGYYQPNKDWIVVIKSNVHGNTQTLSHEIGHFFSLAHPFNGWEACPYDAAEYGNPLAVTLVPCSGELIELVNGSNCEDAADMICDTPPDYNFGLVDPEGNCSLDFEVRDPNGDLIDVMENNYMSYFFNCSSYSFTPTQIDLMRVDYQSSGRNYIRSIYKPDTTLIEQVAPLITAPEYNSTTTYYDYVLLDWDDVPGASNYLIKVTTGFFTKVETYYHVEGTSELLLTELPADEKNVTVIIWPYNEGNSCDTESSVTHKFKTSSIPVSVHDLDLEGDFRLFPSPVSRASGSFILWSERSIPNARIQLTSLDGKVVIDEYRAIDPGQNPVYMNYGALPPSVYVFHLVDGQKSYTKKLLVTE